MSLPLSNDYIYHRSNVYKLAIKKQDSCPYQIEARATLLIPRHRVSVARLLGKYFHNTQKNTSLQCALVLVPDVSSYSVRVFA